MRNVTTKALSLKASKDYDEKWLQALLAREESNLGWGSEEHIQSERWPCCSNVSRRDW